MGWGIARLTRSIASGGGAAFQLIEDAGTLRPPLSFPRGRGFSQGRLTGLVQPHAVNTPVPSRLQSRRGLQFPPRPPFPPRLQTPL